MSLNTAHAAAGGVVIYAGEMILLFCDGVNLDFEGAHGPEFKGNKHGRLYLTTHRMIFTNTNSHDPMQSFSFPFFSLRQLELQQPLLGPNYIKGNVTAQSGGNWDGEAKFKLKFKSGGAIEFGQAMLSAAKMASRFAPSSPPPYVPPPGPYYPADPPAYVPPPSYYGFVQPAANTGYFATAPPANLVFMTSVPPPYPGINAGYAPPQMPQQPTANGTANAKAAEASQSSSSYYDPNNPHYAYMQAPPPYSAAPPTYDEATKKFQ